MWLIDFSKLFSLLCHVAIKIDANSFIVNSSSRGVRENANMTFSTTQGTAWCHFVIFRILNGVSDGADIQPCSGSIQTSVQWGLSIRSLGPMSDVPNSPEASFSTRA
jgi:hypothetical protein